MQFTNLISEMKNGSDLAKNWLDCSHFINTIQNGNMNMHCTVCNKFFPYQVSTFLCFSFTEGANEVSDDDAVKMIMIPKTILKIFNCLLKVYNLKVEI